MELVLDIASSVEFWRQRYPGYRSPKAAAFDMPTECAHRKKDALLLAPPWLNDTFLAPTNGVLHTLTFEHEHRSQANQFVSHSWKGPIPEGSFYKLKDNLYVESPSFMFLHAASILELAQLVAFGDELCGLYSFDRREVRGFRKRTQPLLSKEQLGYYLQSAIGCRGRKQALKAVRHIVDCSASPMETFDEMTMCLPLNYGGYALYQPLMNFEVPLGFKAARIAKRANCYLDMGYPDFDLDIEHHGKLDHSSPEKVASDRARVNALKEEGYEVVELTYEQVADLFAYEYIIERLARRMNKRLPKDCRGATPQRLALRNSVLSWNRSSGRIR